MGVHGGLPRSSTKRGTNTTHFTLASIHPMYVSASLGARIPRGFNLLYRAGGVDIRGRGGGVGGGGGRDRGEDSQCTYMLLSTAE